MQECILYHKLKENKVQCTACRHKCTIDDDKNGLCGVRQNKGGKLYLAVYGKASSVNVDPIEKKPMYHFLPGSHIFSIGTLGCNFSCDFCQNFDISQATKNNNIRNYGHELSPKKIVDTCIKENIKSIAFTYNEPTVFFEYAYDTMKLAKRHGIKNVFVSNGYESDEAIELMKGPLDGINIDLKSFNDEFYKKVCKARLDKVLETIKKVHKSGIWLEITTLVIPGQNDSNEELKKIAEFIFNIDRNIPWHITAFHPDYRMTSLPVTELSALKKAYSIGKKAGLKYVYTGNVIDNTFSNTYCHKCNHLLIRRVGYNTIIEDFEKGKCNKCAAIIPGIWA